MLQMMAGSQQESSGSSFASLPNLEHHGGNVDRALSLPCPCDTALLRGAEPNSVLKIEKQGPKMICLPNQLEVHQF